MRSCRSWPGPASPADRRAVRTVVLPVVLVALGVLILVGAY
ncbi:hypothetical protein OG738_08915 [Amycolatopsis sp. NBC_01488]|nr:hypothetical protein [Amycolatopsis sp. NBC_01488]